MKKLKLHNTSEFLTKLEVALSKKTNRIINEIYIFDPLKQKVLFTIQPREFTNLINVNDFKEWNIKNKMVTKKEPDWTLDAFIMKAEQTWLNEHYSVNLYINNEFAQFKHHNYSNPGVWIEQHFYSDILNITAIKTILQTDKEEKNYLYNTIYTQIDKIKNSKYYIDELEKEALKLLEQIKEYRKIKKDEKEKSQKLWEELKCQNKQC